MKALCAMIAFAAAGFLSACSSKMDQVWTATKSTPVYASESDTEQKVLFTLNAGDT